MKRRGTRLIIILLIFALVIAGAVYCIERVPVDREEIVITIPHNAYIRSIDTNYYKQWLEEQTGLTLKFNIVHEVHSADYLRSMFSSGYVQSDAIFSILNREAESDVDAILQEFGEKGYILPLNDYLEQATHLNAIFENYPDYDLRSSITSSDGNIYYMPGFDASVPKGHFQVLWLNQSWMKELGLKIPQTTVELRDVLYAFKTGDPNGNGLEDEIPLAGSRDVPSEQIYNSIINAFVYNDPDNSHLFIQNGEVRFAPVTDEWRDAMIYLNELYVDGLIDPFSYDHNVFVNLANDPWDMLGGFTSHSVTDILFQSNTELMSSFVHIAPLTGPDGVRNSTAQTPLPKPAGIITSSCKDPEAVFELLDLMLSEEAFLIGRFGEKNIDWVPAGVADRDYYGGAATVKVIHPLQNEVQNKHIGEIGPFYAYPEYADGVTFSANDLDPEYVDARAYRAYEPFLPEERINITAKKPELRPLRQAIDAYTDESTRAFIIGEKDPADDEVWAAHLEKYDTLGMEKLMESVMEELS